MPVILICDDKESDVDDQMCQQLRFLGNRLICAKTDEEFCDLIERFCMGSSSVEEDSISCVILKISEAEKIRKILKIFKSRRTVRRPKLLVLTSFFSWAGHDSTLDVSLPQVFFTRRTPAIGFQAQYELENALYHLKVEGLDISLVAVGLVYGSAGFDISACMSAFYSPNLSDIQATTSLFLRDSHLPMIHISDYINLIANLSRGLKRSEFFFPVVDNSRLSSRAWIQSVLQYLKKSIPVNSSDMCFKDIPNVVKCSEIVKFDIRFITQETTYYPKLSSDSNFDYVLSEYLKAQALIPCRFLIIGPPFCGKTSTADHLAQVFQVPCINALNSIRFVLDSPDSPEIKVLLTAEIEQLCTADVKKGKKIDAFDINSISLTDSLVSSVSKSVRLKCVQSQLSKNPLCQQRGYIIDLWGLIHSYEDILGIFTDDLESISSSYLVSVLDAVVEIHISERKITENWLSRNGCDGIENISKLSKEYQGQLKALEAIIAEYMMKLLDVSFETTNGSLTLRSSREVMHLEENGCRIFRLLFEEFSPATECEKLVDQYMLHRGCPIGWIVRKSLILEDENLELRDQEDNVRMIDTTPQVNHKSSNDRAQTEVLEQNIDKYLEYKMHQVMPALAKLFVCISRSKPSDPISFAYELLSAQAEDVECEQKRSSLIHFQNILAERD